MMQNRLPQKEVFLEEFDILIVSERNSPAIQRKRKKMFIIYQNK